MRIVHRILWTQRNALRVILCAALFTIAAGRAWGQAGPGPIHPPGTQQGAGAEPQDRPVPQTMRSRLVDSWPATPVELAEFEQDLADGLNVRFKGWKDSSGAARRPKILVVDFCTWDGQAMRFGAWLGEQVSAVLTRDGKTFELAEQAQATPAGENAKKSDACESPWDAAESAGADFYLTGRLESMDHDLGLRITVARAVEERIHRPVYFVKSRVAVSNEMEAHIGERLEALLRERYEDISRPRPMSYPKCTYCPAPSYSEQGVKKKISGTVQLLVTVTVDGGVGDVEVKRSLEPSMDEQAIKAVKRWRFEPAKDANGVPMETRTPVLVTFRL